MFLSKKKHKINNPDIRTEAGFTLFYEKYVVYILAVCQEYLSDSDTCEDITSKILISIWERREHLHETITDHSSWKRYLVRAIKNKVYDHIRAQEQSEKYVSQIATALNIAENTVEKEVHFDELAKQVDQLVEQLPARRKEVFKMSRQQGLSYKEIAEHLSISDNAVNQHISKALRYLRNNLIDYVRSNQSIG